MIHKVYSVYDSKTEAFMLPFYCLTRGQAIRSFTEAVNREDHDFKKYPSDFTLFELGEYDDAKGILVSHATPVTLGLAQEFIVSN